MLLPGGGNRYSFRNFVFCNHSVTMKMPDTVIIVYTAVTLG